jgi:hypothetical protein
LLQVAEGEHTPHTHTIIIMLSMLMRSAKVRRPVLLLLLLHLFHIIVLV